MVRRTARDIANWLLMWAEQQEADDAGMTNLKLQKLLYYAQGEQLGRVGRPLFTDRIEAWAHGPVVKSEYHRLKNFGNGAIDTDEAVPEDFNWDDYRDVEQLLMLVWNTYGRYAAWTLREMTHREPPWRDAFNGERDVEITTEALRDFFSRN